MKPFADIHCHPTLHPFAFYESKSKKKNSLWSDNAPRKRQRDDKYPEYYQSAMPALARGNVRLIIASLYPLEQPWFDPAITGTGKVTDIMAGFLTVHIPIDYINTVQDSQFNYFEYLQKEYHFLLKENGVPHTLGQDEWKYVLPENSDDIKDHKDDQFTLIVVPSIEGAHSMISANANDIVEGNYDFDKMIENIISIKKWDYPPLFVTLGHHFYNGLCGHSRTIPDGIPSFLIKQNVGMNEPLNKRGEEVIDCLLGFDKYGDSGRRILIDIKHMSVAARMQFYEMIASVNESRTADNKIPIVASHCGYSGHHTLSDAILVPDTEPTKSKKPGIFNPWSNNLTDEDVVNIFKSGGIIGINLDQRILSGVDVIKESKKFSKQDILENADKIVKFWTEQIAKNILGMAKAVVNSKNVGEDEKVKIWDVISIGSDFDGMINPVDSFIVADEFKDLRSALAKYMPGLPDFDLCAQGLSIDEILDKIMYDNALEFVLRNYR
jgi:hypothetical protein